MSESYLPEMITSRVPFISTARRLTRAFSHGRTSSSDSISSGSEAGSEAPSTTPSGASTPLLHPSSDLSMTQFESIPLSNTRASSSSIDWTSAALGHHMLTSAAQRAQCSDDVTARMMYIDALKYLHCGLPSDVSEQERQTLQALLPGILTQEGPRIGDNVSPGQAAHPGTRLVRSSTASIVAFIIALIMLALPLVAALLDRLLEYERKHHITERLVNATCQLVRSLGEKGITFGGIMCSLSQRQVGTYALVSLIGIVHSVVDGVNDGVERSLESRRSGEAKRDDMRLTL